MTEGFAFATATNMATGERFLLNIDYIESMQPFVLDGEEHCFINMVTGKQFKVVEKMEEVKGDIENVVNRPKIVNWALGGNRI